MRNLNNQIISNTVGTAHTDAAEVSTRFQPTPHNAYTISEVFPNSTWIPTTATSAPVQVLTSDIAGPNFGNVCVSTGGGLTMGYWSNQNGAAEWLPIPFDNPYLVGPGTTKAVLWIYENFSSTSSYSAFRTWLLNASATNMAYMLSAQLAAMWENVNGGTTGPNGTRVAVNATALIYVGPSAGTAPTGCTKPATTAGGFASVQNVMNAASCALGTTAGLNTIKGGSTRSYEQWLKNALDAANNNNAFVQVPPGDGTIPAACSFTTPY
jgi:hypothetical protein